MPPLRPRAVLNRDLLVQPSDLHPARVGGGNCRKRRCRDGLRALPLTQRDERSAGNGERYGQLVRKQSR